MKLRAVGVISKPKKEDICSVAPGLLDWLKQRGIEAVYDEETARCLDLTGGVPRPQIPARVDLLVVLGGDGTLLATARALENHEVPILAVNLGSLGFLTEITLDEMYSALEAVLADRHRLEARRQLAGEVERKGQVVARYWALNDIVLHKASLARILDFDVSIDAHFVSRIRADGLIVSTPTGSTAYSLSAGGPIVLPSVEAMVVTPIAPHMLTNRPLVIPGNSVVEVVAASPGEHAYVTADGQEGEELDTGSRVRLRVSDRKVQLVTSPNRDYFQVLRSKLHWGER
ncbi:MAG TPA: NAD(+)/NADH kinase [Candidatus Acidoferrales bacterium]|nr:NAD(+)/NADH kinase [Candidatus Acidoferrales bacterium]